MHFLERQSAMADTNKPLVVTSLRGVPTKWAMSLTASANSRGPSESFCRTPKENAIISSPINNADGVE